MDKAHLRKMLQERLLELTDKQRSLKSRQACENVAKTEQFKKASVVMAYLSLPHEVDTARIILQALQDGKTVVVPKVSWQQRHMIPVQITSLETGFATETTGLRNPITGVPVPIEDIDLVITPGLGFDMEGNRLGRGGAYYDRFFDNPELRAAKCGFVFSEQLVESIPVLNHDEKVDLIVTEKEVIYAKKSTPGSAERRS